MNQPFKNFENWWSLASFFQHLVIGVNDPVATRLTVDHRLADEVCGKIESRAEPPICGPAFSARVRRSLHYPEIGRLSGSK
jgi:hypothetical protein